MRRTIVLIFLFLLAGLLAVGLLIKLLLSADGTRRASPAPASAVVSSAASAPADTVQPTETEPVPTGDHAGEPETEDPDEPPETEPDWRVYQRGMAAAMVARTYYLAAESGREDFAYGNDHFFADTTGKGKNLDCSEYVSLVLRGVTYAESPFVRTGQTIRDGNRPGWAGTILDDHPRIDDSYPPEAKGLRTLTYAKNYLSLYRRYIRQLPLDHWLSYPVPGGRLFYTDKEHPYVRAWEPYADRELGFGFSVKMSADLAECFYYPALAGEGKVVWYNPRRLVRTLTKTNRRLQAADAWKNETAFEENRCPASVLRPGDLLFFAGASNDAPNRVSHDRFLSITHVGIVAEDPAFYYEVNAAEPIVNRTKVPDRGANCVLVLRPAFYRELSLPAWELYYDLPEDEADAEAVRWAVAEGITRGVSTDRFGTDKACTRAAVLTFLWRAAGSPAPEGDKTFSDVKEGSFYAEAAKWAASLDLIRPKGEDKLLPEAVCSRGELVLLLWRLSGAPGEAPDPSVYPTFPDVTAVSPYAAAVEWAASAGLLGDSLPAFFYPDRPATRLEVVRMLYALRP